MYADNMQNGMLKILCLNHFPKSNVSYFINELTREWFSNHSCDEVEESGGVYIMIVNRNQLINWIRVPAIYFILNKRHESIHPCKMFHCKVDIFFLLACCISWEWVSEQSEKLCNLKKKTITGVTSQGEMLTVPPWCAFCALVPWNLKNIELTNWICLVPPALNLDVTWARIICLLPQMILAHCPWSHSLRSYRWWLWCSQWVVSLPSVHKW